MKKKEGKYKYLVTFHDGTWLAIRADTVGKAQLEASAAQKLRRREYNISSVKLMSDKEN